MRDFDEETHMTTTQQPVLAKGMTPSAIVRYLDQYVVGQDDAKRTLAVAVYSHYRKIERSRADAVELAKSNILLVGSTGTGKTLLCETLSKALNVPFVTVDAVSMAQTEYVNEEIEAMLRRLLDKADGDVARAQCGIIFVDEVDKLKAVSGQSRSASGEAVQNALLKIMEGAPVQLKNHQYIDTSNILFICGGAFVGLENILVRTHAFGFISASEDDSQKILDRLNARVKPTDLFEFGLIPEFAGRLPIVARLQDLSRDMLVRIMTEPRNSVYKQFREILAEEGVELVIEKQVLEQIADLAIEYKIGARSLRGIFEEMITPVLYVVPDSPDIQRVVIASLFEDATLVRGSRGNVPATSG
jgi:ATP-dependent Clp protease ATP-binding subunit ClpX